jgi:hypothetical protein
MMPTDGRKQLENPMSTTKYLCMYRGAPSQNKPSPAQMQEMFAAFNEWKEKFKANILDMGSKLKPTGRVLTASGVTDGPFAEGKEVVGGFMILGADDYEGALAVVKAMPMMQSPGACVEIREMASF